MRHLTILALATIFVLISTTNALATDLCGFEKTPAGRVLFVKNYVMVAVLRCKDPGLTAKGNKFTNSTLVENAYKKGLAFFDEKIKSGSCRNELGSIRKSQDAYDKWNTSSANAAQGDMKTLCTEASRYIDQVLTPAAVRTSSIVREVEKSNLNLKQSYASNYSSSYSSGSLLRPTSLAYTDSYKNLLPVGYYAPAFMNMPAFFFMGHYYGPQLAPAAVNPLLIQQQGGAF
jgi:hypothetical protein